MSVARTWKLQINLDAVNAGYLSLSGSKEKADFLDGLIRGMNQGAIHLKATEAMTAGFLIGQEMRLEAESFRKSMKAVGRLGGRPKAERKETQLKPSGFTLDPLGEPPGFIEGTQGEPNPQSPIKDLPLLNQCSDGPGDADEFMAIITVWNTTLVPQGYSECKATPLRMMELKKRLREDSEFLETFKQATTYLAAEPYWRERAGALNVDFLLRPGKAKEFSEKKPTLKDVRVGSSNLDGITEEYLAGRGIGDGIH